LKRIGLFGGSFDPVHLGHLALARTALAHLQLDELRWVPSGQSWQKGPAHAGAEDRAAMVQAAIAGEPRFVLERCEIERSGPSYTIDTLRTLQAGSPGASWFLVIGQDQYANLHTWHEWQALLGLATIAVAARDTVMPDVSNTPLAHTAHQVVHLPMPAVPVSATILRQQLAAGQPATELASTLVPPAVASYIARHGLYPAIPTPSHLRS
jgi:nicotinate-nucleotide adenylyltransferase